MEPEIFYFHGMTLDSPYNNFTVAGTFIKDAAIRQLTLGISICSKNDQFSKKKGRLIATNRVLNQKDECAGRVCITLNEVRAASLGYFSYTESDTIKTFVGEASWLNKYSKEELLTMFGLLNHHKS